MLGVGKVATAQQVRGVAEQPRAHRIALAGDRVGAGSRPADIAGEQCEIDDALGDARAFVTLVDSHRPPERDALRFADRAGDSAEDISSDTGLCGHALERKRFDKRCEVREAGSYGRR